MRQKISDLISIEEAMATLSSLSSMNMKNPPLIGLIGEARIVINQGDDRGEIEGVFPVGIEALQKAMDITYRSVHSYLLSLHYVEERDRKKGEKKKGVSALMSLVGESAQKMTGYLAYHFGHQVLSLDQLPSYRELQEYFAKNLKGEPISKEDSRPRIPKRSELERRDYETLIKDREYELFYISDEGGDPYLSDRLLRNIQVTADFDQEMGSFEEDPYLRVKAIQDRDFQSAAHQILDACQEEISTFYMMKKKIFGFFIAKQISSAILALYLAENGKNLAQRTAGKPCTLYFNDFHYYLREALGSSEYKKWIAYPPEEDEKRFILDFVHKLCFTFITRECGVKHEATGLIHRTEKRGKELHRSPLGKGTWNQLLYEDELLRAFLDRFPEGPLLKTLETIRFQKEGELTYFDPWFQGSSPSKAYSIKGIKKGKSVDILQFGAPIRQGNISCVEIIEEFWGFLRYLKSHQRCHLLINLQNPLSWQEGTRCAALEKIEGNTSNSSSFVMITLPKQTDFYHQTNGFENLDDADSFISAFIDQLENPRESGFFFPSNWKLEELIEFSKMSLKKIHKEVFGEIAQLTRQMRQDFIELFYQLFLLEAIDRFNVDSVSFTCKDGVDAGAYSTALFFAFLKGYGGDLDVHENLETLRMLFYWKAMSVRERAPDPEQFFRTLSCIERWHRSVEKGGSSFTKKFSVNWVA